MSANLSRKFLRALECPYCSRQFVSRRELLVHQWSHKERAAYQCTQCEKTFTREELFRRHMVNHQKEESAKVTCEICNKSFRNQRTLEQHHLKTHAGQKPFHCQTCGIQFSWKHNLRKHEHIHKDKPFACLVCHEAFRDVEALNMHIRMHKLAQKEQEREKALQNQWRRDNLPGIKEKEKGSEPKTFPRIVPVRDRPPPASNGTPPAPRTPPPAEENDEQEDDDSLYKPYKCKVCNQAFMYTFTLEAHMKGHSEEKRTAKNGKGAVPSPLEKPNVCSICNEAFRWEFCLDAHVKIHQQHQEDGTFYYKGNRVPKPVILAPPDPNVPPIIIKPEAEAAKSNSMSNKEAASSDQEASLANKEVVATIDESAEVLTNEVAQQDQEPLLEESNMKVPESSVQTDEKDVPKENEQKENIENVALPNQNPINVELPDAVNEFGHIIRVELITATGDGLQEQVNVHEIEMTTGSTTIPTKDPVCMNEVASVDNVAIVSVPDAEQIDQSEQYMVPAAELLSSSIATEGVLDGAEPSASELVELQNNLPSLEDIKYVEEQLGTPSHGIQAVEQVNSVMLTDIESVAQQIESADLADSEAVEGVDSSVLAELEQVENQVDPLAFAEQKTDVSELSPVVTEMKSQSEPQEDSLKLVKTKSNKKRRNNTKKQTDNDVSSDSVSMSKTDVTDSVMDEMKTESISSSDVMSLLMETTEDKPVEEPNDSPIEPDDKKKSCGKPARKSRNRSRKSAHKYPGESVSVEAGDMQESDAVHFGEEGFTLADDPSVMELSDQLECNDVSQAATDVATPPDDSSANVEHDDDPDIGEQTKSGREKGKKGSSKRGRGRSKKASNAGNSSSVQAEVTPATPESCEPVITPLYPPELEVAESTAEPPEVEAKKTNKRTPKSCKTASRKGRSAKNATLLANDQTDLMDNDSSLTSDGVHIADALNSKTETEPETLNEQSTDVFLNADKNPKRKKRSRRSKAFPRDLEELVGEDEATTDSQITDVHSSVGPEVELTSDSSKVEPQVSDAEAQFVSRNLRTKPVKNQKTKKGRKSKKSKASEFVDESYLENTLTDLHQEYQIDSSETAGVEYADMTAEELEDELTENVLSQLSVQGLDEGAEEAGEADATVSKSIRSSKTKRGRSRGKKTRSHAFEKELMEETIAETPNSDISNLEAGTTSTLTEDSLIADYKGEDVKDEESQELPPTEQAVADKPASKKRKRKSRKSATSMPDTDSVNSIEVNPVEEPAKSANETLDDLPVEHVANIGGLEFYYSVSQFAPGNEPVNPQHAIQDVQEHSESHQIQPSIDSLIECDKLEIPAYDSSGTIPVLDVTNEDLLPELCVEKPRRKRRKSRSKKRKSIESDQDAAPDKKANYESLLPSWDTPISASWDTAMMEAPINNLLQNDTSILDEKIELQDEPMEPEVRPETKKKGKKKRRKSDREKQPLTEINTTMQTDNWNTLSEVPTEQSASPILAVADSILEDIQLADTSENIVDSLVEELAAESPIVSDTQSPSKPKVRRRRRKKDLRKAIQSRVTAIRSEIDFESDSTQQSDSTAASVEPVFSSLKLTVKFYSCDFCSKAFTRRTSLLAHRFFNHSPRNGNCYERTMSLKDLTLRRCIIGKLRKRYKRIYTTQRPYSCIECHKEFIHHGYLTFHEEGHENITRTYFCHHCDLTMYSWLECIAHQMNHRKGLC